MTSKIAHIVETSSLINLYIAGGEKALALLGIEHDTVLILPTVQMELKRQAPEVLEALKRVSQTLNPKITLIPEQEALVPYDPANGLQAVVEEMKRVMRRLPEDVAVQQLLLKYVGTTDVKYDLLTDNEHVYSAFFGPM